MKFVLNECFGGFSLPEEFCEVYDCDSYDDIDRTDKRLIDFLETYFSATGKDFYEGDYSHLIIEEIPDTATDWHINDYDGAESLIYVVDGKLHWA